MAEELHSGVLTQEYAYFCPTCGSPSVETQTLGLISPEAVTRGNRASCKACGWAGRDTELLATPFQHGFANSEEVINNLMGDFRVLMSKEFLVPFGKFLIKWGFLSVPLQPAQITRYLVRASHAALLAVFAERQREEEERVSGRPLRN